MKRALACVFAGALILALFFVAGRLLHKDEDLRIHPETPITLIHVDGTKETGPYREMKDRVLQDGGRLIVEKRGRSRPR